VSWALANYFLVRGERTYVMLIDIKEVQTAVDRPEYERADRIGTPLEVPQKLGNVWIRRYEHGLVVVNPVAMNAATLFLGTSVYRDLANQTFTGTISGSPATGLVLFNEAMQRSHKLHVGRPQIAFPGRSYPPQIRQRAPRP
jgi:hypothetical protein